ncbi:hypothetical protein [Kitasatospora albolonga]|uniref:hypothetical protein n=1 Tax=Kitasatospora albolonga TaxID=68173 RepID=UPI0031E6743D
MIVSLMASDLWSAFRGRVVALWSRRGGESAEEQLDVERDEVLASGDAGSEWMAEGVEAALRLRLARLLREDPEVAAALRALAEEAEAALPDAGGRGRVVNTINGDVRDSTVLQGERFGDVHIN